jgi:hypothetical protein
MSRPSKWAILWLLWLLALVGLEWAAVRSRHPKPRTLTEHLARWFPRRWRRALLVGLMALLTWHFWGAADIGLSGRGEPGRTAEAGTVDCPDRRIAPPAGTPRPSESDPR